MFFHIIAKIVFNMCVHIKLDLDMWTVMDLIVSAFNITLFNYIGACKLEHFTNPLDKDLIDYSIIIIMGMAWLRFFMYFLVLKPVSKVIFTLFRMVQNILSFMFVFMCYIVMASILFTMVFGHVEPHSHGSLTLSMKTLFFAFNGHYSYTVNEDYEWSYSCFTMAHVIITWVFLLNFLIAMMCRTYYIMLEKGDFLYKKTKYQYIEKYSIPMLN